MIRKERSPPSQKSKLGYFGAVFSSARRVAALLVGLVIAGCPKRDPNEARRAAVAAQSASGLAEEGTASPGSPRPPRAPLALRRPPAPPRKQGAVELAQATPSELLRGARRHARENNYAEAATLQRWAVENGAEDAYYDLACYVARAGRIDEAFYWLQEAAAKQGVDPDWANRDGDLAALRKDGRWPAVRRFLGTYGEYFAKSGSTEDELLVPTGYDRKTPLPLLVVLHGLGSNPRDFLSFGFQPLATREGLAVLGVSGSRPRGPHRFAWSEDPDVDLRRVDDALAQVASKLQIQPGAQLLMGFSQGAAMAIEIAVRQPARFAGAIGLSPGLGTAKAVFDGLRTDPARVSQGFVLSSNQGEHPTTLALMKDYEHGLGMLNARTYSRLVPKLSKHAFPPDLEAKLPAWIAFVLDKKASKPIGG
jgi:pimeloyl-ACP methyl ester carboxylesterase